MHIRPPKGSQYGASYRNNAPLAWSIMAMAIVGIISLGSVRGWRAYVFKAECLQYLHRSANASSLETAQAELGKALAFLEAKNLTSGVVSIFLKQPRNDVGFWYENLKQQFEQISAMGASTSQLEITNFLMKHREVITDQTQQGTVITHPKGISIYPKNQLFFWMFTLVIGCALGGIVRIVQVEQQGTIVEVLVIIAIVGILAAVAIPMILQ